MAIGLRLSALRWPVLLSLYLASRLTGLMALPMFLDERIHLRWAYWIDKGRRLRLPVLAGRGLSVYLLALVAPHADDPLRAGRLLTVAIGLITLVASWRLAFRLTGDRRTADVTALFSIACPFTLLYDRMVLTDAFLAAFTAVTVLLSVAVVEEPRLRTGAALGLALALGVLSKTSGLVLFAVPFLAWVLLARDRRRALMPLAEAYTVAAALVGYPLWLFFRRTDELAGALGLRDRDASFPGNASTNLGLAASWLWTYWTPPLIVLALIGLTMALVQRDRARAALLMALLAFGPAIAFVAFSEIWYPRYLLFTTVSLLPLSAWGLVALADLVGRHIHAGSIVRGALAAVGLTLVLVPAVRFDRALWTDPAQAPLPALDRFQYVTGWPSGYGVADTVAYLRARATPGTGGVTIVAPTSSVTASTLRLLNGPKFPVEVVCLEPGDPSATDALRDLARTRIAYVLVSPRQNARLSLSWAAGVRHEFTSYKPDGAVADELYRICGLDACPSLHPRRGAGAFPTERAE